MNGGSNFRRLGQRRGSTVLKMQQKPEMESKLKIEASFPDDEEVRRWKGPPRVETTSTIESCDEKGENPVCRQPRTATALAMDGQPWNCEYGQYVAHKRRCILTRCADFADTIHSRSQTFTESIDMLSKRSPTFDESKLRDLRKYHYPGKQLRKLLLEGLYRWAITAVLILCLYITLWHYSNKPVMSGAKKLQFNTLVTGLSIGLGLSIADSLKQMALELRWWILSLRKRSLYEVSLFNQVSRTHKSDRAHF